MTTFGKIVMSSFAAVTLFAIYYGTVSYVKEDSRTVPSAQESASLSTSDATTTLATTTEEMSNKPSFTTVLQQGGIQKCSIVQPMGQMTSTGVVYINKALVRAEFSVSVMDKTIETTMIARDGYMYSWTKGSAQEGTKTKMPTAESVKQSAGKAPTVRTWNGDQVKEYTCEDWTPDETIFEIPKTITFKDVIG